MTKAEQITVLAKLIIETNGGKINFNLREAAVIVGCNKNLIATRLQDAGILVTTSGKDKYVTAIGIAECVYANQRAAIDNSLRGLNHKKDIKRVI